MSDKNCEIEIEIESLNLDHLDVEELEHRLEMAIGGPVASAFCYIFASG